MHLICNPKHQGLSNMLKVILIVSGRIIGLFRLSYLTPGLMCAGVTEVIVEKEQEKTKKEIKDEKGKRDEDKKKK